MSTIPGQSHKAVTVLAVAFAMVLPTLLIWLWWAVLAQGGVESRPNLLQQTVYAVGNLLQFGFPLFFVRWVDARWPDWHRPRRDGLAWGLGFGLLVAVGILILYFAFLKTSTMWQEASAQLRGKLQEFGITSPLAFIGLALFMAVAHSGLEEYYWRWFVFGRLRTLLPTPPAVALASAAFMAHHVLLLNALLPGRFVEVVLPFSLAVAIGGVFWCWLYERTGSLWWPWLSHILIDAALMVVGWDLLGRAQIAS